MRSSLLAFAVIVALSANLDAGVVYTVDVTDFDSEPAQTETMQVSAQGGDLKMQMSRGDMIYIGSARQLIFVNHDDKSYFVMDEETMKSLAGQISQATKQMQEMLENVPEDQRAQFEQMMKQRMPNMGATQKPERALRPMGQTGSYGQYECDKYEVLANGVKDQELCVTDWNNVEGGDEVAGTFREMSGFLKTMMETMASASGGFIGAMDENPYEFMQELNGFPVHSIDFEGQEKRSESTLKNAESRSLDASIFEPPSGYKRQDYR